MPDARQGLMSEALGCVQPCVSILGFKKSQFRLFGSDPDSSMKDVGCNSQRCLTQRRGLSFKLLRGLARFLPIPDPSRSFVFDCRYRLAFEAIIDISILNNSRNTAPSASSLGRELSNHGAPTTHPTRLGTKRLHLHQPDNLKHTARGSRHLFAKRSLRTCTSQFL